MSESGTAQRGKYMVWDQRFGFTFLLLESCMTLANEITFLNISVFFFGTAESYQCPELQWILTMTMNKRHLEYGRLSVHVSSFFLEKKVGLKYGDKREIKGDRTVTQPHKGGGWKTLGQKQHIPCNTPLVIYQEEYLDNDCYLPPKLPQIHFLFQKSAKKCSFISNLVRTWKLKIKMPSSLHLFQTIDHFSFVRNRY